MMYFKTHYNSIHYPSKTVSMQKVTFYLIEGYLSHGKPSPFTL